jgi:hypothetical protein
MEKMKNADGISNKKNLGRRESFDCSIDIMGYLKYIVHIGTNVTEEPEVCIICIKRTVRGFICQLGTHPLALHDGNVRRQNLRTQYVNDTTISKRILNKWFRG